MGLISGIRKLFNDPVESPQSVLVVEVERGKRPESPSKEVRESVLSLQYHPGFQYLMSKFRFQRDFLDAKLRSEHHKDTREVDFLQSGIGWLNWCQAQVDFETGRPKEETKSSTSYEKQLFEQVNANINVLQ